LFEDTSLYIYKTLGDFKTNNCDRIQKYITLLIYDFWEDLLNTKQECGVC